MIWFTRPALAAVMLPYSAVVGSNQPGDTTNTQTLRGLFAPTMQRDGFMPAQTTGATFTNNFDLEHVDIVKGPQSLLYGGGGGSGGIINLVSKQARPRAGVRTGAILDG